LRWYNGQLAKAFIKKHYKEAKAALENFCEIGILNVKAGQYNGLNEYHLDQSLRSPLKVAIIPPFRGIDAQVRISRLKRPFLPFSARIFFCKRPFCHFQRFSTLSFLFFFKRA
jgi:hypothetical protein